MSTLLHSSKVHTAFFKAHGPGPHKCFYCEKVVKCKWSPKAKRFLGAERWSVAIHHKDENQLNNRPGNLKMSHFACHTVHHGTGRRHTPEAGAKIAASNSRRVWKPESLQRISEASKLRWEEARKAGRTHL